MNWERIAAEFEAVGREVCGPMRPAIEALAGVMVACLRAGHKILVCGNGGSAAEAQHFSAELVNRFLRNRRPYAALALTTDPSVVTSVGNDFGFDQVFEKQVQALGRPGDLLVILSTSGRSTNLLRAAAAARALGVQTVAITGGQGGPLKEAADHVLCVASSGHTPRIQEGHLLILHALCERIEEQLD